MLGKKLALKYSKGKIMPDGRQFSRTVKLIGKDGLANLPKQGFWYGHRRRGRIRRRSVDQRVGALTLIDGDKYCKQSEQAAFATHSAWRI